MTSYTAKMGQDGHDRAVCTLQFVPLTPQCRRLCPRSGLYAPFNLQPLTPSPSTRISVTSYMHPSICDLLHLCTLKASPWRSCMHPSFSSWPTTRTSELHMLSGNIHSHDEGVLILVLVKKKERYFPSDIPSSD